MLFMKKHHKCYFHITSYLQNYVCFGEFYERGHFVMLSKRACTIKSSSVILPREYFEQTRNPSWETIDLAFVLGFFKTFTKYSNFRSTGELKVYVPAFELK